jgi:hypothetical protein
VAAASQGFRLAGVLADRLRAQVSKFMAKGYSQTEALELAEHALGRGVDLLDQVEVPDRHAPAPVEPPLPEPTPSPVPVPSPPPPAPPPPAPAPAVRVQSRAGHAPAAR